MSRATSPGYRARGIKPPTLWWTNKEEAILRQTYPKSGAEACVQLLPRRTRSGIYGHARALGLKSPKSRASPRPRLSSNPMIDGMIRRTYEAAPKKNAINELARRLGRPRWWVSARACKLGLVVPRFKEPLWTPAEDAIIEEAAHRCPATLRRRLARAGFERSEAGIVCRRKRLHLDLSDPSHYTANELAGLMGVDAKIVTGWIEKEWLVAAKRGTARTAQQGGDQWWIKRGAVRDFVADNAAAVDLRKVDRFWFIDLLVGKYE